MGQAWGEEVSLIGVNEKAGDIALHIVGKVSPGVTGVKRSMSFWMSQENPRLEIYR